MTAPPGTPGVLEKGRSVGYRWVTKDEAGRYRCKGTTMADFSLELNEDQVQLQKWVHDFAEDVVLSLIHI